VRLNRYLSLCGLGSRRSCEQIIKEGRVAINGQCISELATTVESSDRVAVDGNTVHAATPLVVVLHKPAGYLCTREDTHGRATLYDILPGKYQQLHHVGRLDQDSEGLILLTNQGDLSQRLLHPSEGVEKEYEVTLDKEFDPKHVSRLTRGVQTVEGFGKAEHVHMDAPRRLHVVLKQGLKRQIRLMFYEIGYEVTRLIRVRIGALKLSGLGAGQWRELRQSEVEQYFKPAKARKSTSNIASTSADDDVFPSARRNTPTARKDVRSDPDRRTSPRAGKSSGDKPRLGGARKAHGEKRYGPAADTRSSDKPKRSSPGRSRSDARSERSSSPKPARPDARGKRGASRDRGRK
jgi:23S rRNA pseudouridine2605 synthase